MKSRAMLICAAGLLLSACGQPDPGDLASQLETISKGIKPQLAPLPATKPLESFTLDASQLTDPFHPWGATPAPGTPQAARKASKPSGK